MTIQGGLNYIAKQQLKGGGFTSYRLDEVGDGSIKSYRTTFIPSLIALALKDVPGSEKIQKGINRFLLDQKSSSWSWNYWDRHSALMRKMPYPDDLDDTFLALAALWHYDQTFLTPTVMARMTNLLFATESRTGGPYSTWLIDGVADEVWRDIDLVVNINIAYFLSLQDVELPHLNQLVETAIGKKQLHSPYYPPTQPAAYFLARWYRGDSVLKLKKLIYANQVLGAWETPHQTALAVCTLLRLGTPAKELQVAIEYLQSTQNKNGSWPAGPMCSDTMRTGEKKVYFAGSSSLTTAICLEALTLYEQNAKVHPHIAGKSAKRNYEKVVKDVTDSIKALGLGHKELQVNTQAVLKKILARDSDKQIVMLPWLIQQAASVEVDEETLHNLGVASLWGWMAYTVYDDFLDQEGDPKCLPSAIFANRRLLDTLQATLTDNIEFQTDIDEIMNRLDEANAWEVSHCRGNLEGDVFTIAKLPDYSNYWQLADRSLGHTISGLGVLYGAGVSKTAPQLKGLKDFFRYYLIARQLNDDAHDWEEDLMRGHVNAVGLLILKKWADETHGSLEEGINLKKEGKKLQLIMWEQVIDEVCNKVNFYVDEARNILAKPGVNLDQKQLLPLLTPLEEAAKKALQTRDQALEFISAL
jgi:hypothetical protein